MVMVIGEMYMAKYLRRTVIIDAEQFFPDKNPWPQGVYTLETGFGPLGKLTVINRRYYISTLAGEMEVLSGDFIITEVEGKRYACKKDIFNMTYERIDLPPKPVPPPLRILKEGQIPK